MKKFNMILILMFILLVSSVSATIDWDTDVLTFLPLANVTGSPTGLTDLSNAGNDGTAGNGITFTNSSQDSFDFNGTDQYISLDGLETTSTSQTLAVWINFDSVSGDQYVFDAQTGRMILLINQGNPGDISIYDGAAFRDFDTNPATDSWTLVTLVLDGSSNDADLYYNDSQHGVTETYTPRQLDDAIAIGSVYSKNSNFFDGQMSGFTLFNRTLTTTEISNLYAQGRNYNPYATASNFTITTDVTDYNITMIANETIEYVSTTATYTTNILENDTRLWNITLSAENKYDLTFTNYNVSTGLSEIFPSYSQITLYDVWNNNSLTTFNATINGTLYTTTSSVIHAPYKTNLSVVLEAYNYFDRNVTLSFLENSTHNISMSQSEITFEGYELSTNDLLSDVTFYVNGVNGTNLTTYYLSTGSHNVTAEKNGYYNITQEFNVTALDNLTVDVTGLYDTILNITAQEYQTNTTLNTFNVTLSKLLDTGYWRSTGSTTNGTILIHALNGTDYILTSSKTSYADNSEDLNLTSGVYNHTIDYYKAASVYMTWYDEDSLEILDHETINLELIGASFGNYTTSNGTYIAENLTPGDYTLRFDANEYDERFYYFTVVSGSYNVLSLYLLNSTEVYNLTTTVVDENYDVVPAATVKALRYIPSTGNYELRDQCETGNSGTCVLRVSYNDEYYKFQVEYDGDTELTTVPEYVISSSVVLQIYLGTAIGENYFEWGAIDASLEFNNATNNFRLTYNDANGVATNFTLYVYTLKYGAETLIGSGSNALPSGTILVNTGTLQNDTLYVARAYYEDNFLISATHQTESTNPFGNFGLLLQIIITILFIGIAIYDIGLVPISISTSLILGRIISLNVLDWSTIWIITIVGIIITLLIKRYK